MRQMRDKKKALQARFSHASTKTTTNNLDNDEALAPTSSSSATASVKRKNPFRYSVKWLYFLIKKCLTVAHLDRRSPAKRPKLLTVTQDDQRNASANVDFMSMLNAPNVKADTNKELAVELPQALSIFTAVTPVCQKVDQCPVDWSLKTRVRFTSKSPFAFSSTLKVCLSISSNKNTRFYDSAFRPRRPRRLLESQVSWDASALSNPTSGARWTRQQMRNFINAACCGNILGCLGYLYSLGTHEPLSLPPALSKSAWTRACQIAWSTTGVKAFALFSDFCARGNAHSSMSALINSLFSFELLE